MSQQKSYHGRHGWRLLLAFAVTAACIALAIAWRVESNLSSGLQTSRELFCEALQSDLSFLQEGLTKPTTGRMFSPLIVRPIASGADYCVPDQAETIENLALHLRANFAILISDTHPPESKATAAKQSLQILDDLRRLIDLATR